MSQFGARSVVPSGSSLYPNHAVPGGDFILNQPATIPAVWGNGRQVLWSQGEALLLVGPSGVGKSTVAQQLALRRVGVLGGPFLGFTVARDSRRLLYLALDRPSQIARSFFRMVSPQDRATLNERLIVWPKPLSFDVVKQPAELAAFSSHHEAGTLVIDSLKDLTVGLEKADVGHSIAHAFQHLVAAGIEIVALHHRRKSSGDNPKPNKLDDSYGSAFLPATAGSVIALDGAAGATRVKLVHQKQPAETVGPLDLIHDHRAGTTGLLTSVEPLALMASKPQGLTVKELAIAETGEPDPERRHVEQARRRLKRLVESGACMEVGGDGRRGEPDKYVLSATRGPHGGSS